MHTENIFIFQSLSMYVFVCLNSLNMAVGLGEVSSFIQRNKLVFQKHYFNLTYPTSGHAGLPLPLSLQLP